MTHVFKMSNFHFPPECLCDEVVRAFILYRDGLWSAEYSSELIAKHAEQCQCIQTEVRWNRIGTQFMNVIPASIKARLTNPRQLWLSRLDRGVTISTVLLTSPVGRPFETMVSGLSEELFVTYDTPQEAMRGHEKLRRELPKKIRTGDLACA